MSQNLSRFLKRSKSQTQDTYLLQDPFHPPVFAWQRRMLGLTRLTIVVALLITMWKGSVAMHTPLLSNLVWGSHKRFLMQPSVDNPILPTFGAAFAKVS